MFCVANGAVITCSASVQRECAACCCRLNEMLSPVLNYVRCGAAAPVPVQRWCVRVQVWYGMCACEV